MKKLIITILVIVFSASLFTTQSFAGSKQKHRWEGAAIGLGAAILGGAILNNSRSSNNNRAAGYNNSSCYYPASSRPYRQQYVPHRRPVRHERPKNGHWEVRKVWVAPVHERVWNPSHYNRRNEWVEGSWINIEQQPGYWKEDRVWISYR
ncbi:hypothetical protein QUF76_00070 [Desulfobacterales bacterium HSG16]|nr:hypothetical protein [Desulfobacterales bacterium HSG16]